MTISIVRSTRRRIAYAVAIAATAATLPLSAPSALAADILAQPRPPAVEKPLWTGVYIGVHGGRGWGSSNVDDPGFAITYYPVSVKSSGWLAGAQVGANWQFGSFVVGGELDVSGASVKGNTVPDPAVLLSGLSAKFLALATGTGRVGYAAGNLLGYAKGGLAWANIDFQSALGTPFPIDVNHQRSGLTAGAGLEVALARSLSARIEYDYIYFGAASINLGDPRSPSNVDHQLHLVKVGLNWLIDGDYLLAR
jgi:outer membrane immunogenic protein